jgi:hypothetical protein
MGIILSLCVLVSLWLFVRSHIGAARQRAPYRKIVEHDLHGQAFQFCPAVSFPKTNSRSRTIGQSELDFQNSAFSEK